MAVNVAYAGSDVVLSAWASGPNTEPGQVALFDGRTGGVRWHRRSPHTAPRDRFGVGLATLDGDVVVGPGAFRLDGVTGGVVQTYDGPSPSGVLATDGKTVAIAGTVGEPDGDRLSVIRVYDADDGRLTATVSLEPPDAEGITRIAMSGRHLAVVTDNYNGVGRGAVFSR